MRSGERGNAVEAVIFDLDGVLIDSEWIGFEAWQDVVRGYGGELDDSAYAGIVGLTQERSAEYVMAQAGITFDLAESCERAWECIIKRLKTENRPLPGAVELVQALDRRGCALAIASNGITHYVDGALEGLGLAAYFPVRVCVDQVEHGKPAPDVYLGAIRELGMVNKRSIDPARCLAVEDSSVGVQSAAAAGLRVIGVPGPHVPEGAPGFEQAWKVFPSLVEVNDALDELLSM